MTLVHIISHISALHIQECCINLAVAKLGSALAWLRPGSFIFLYISSSWVELRLCAKFQLHMLLRNRWFMLWDKTSGASTYLGGASTYLGGASTYLSFHRINGFLSLQLKLRLDLGLRLRLTNTNNESAHSLYFHYKTLLPVQLFLHTG